MKYHSFKNNRGIILITVYMVVVVLMILGAAFLVRVIHEAKTSERERHSTEALYIAEGALQQILLDLQQDVANDPTPDWFDGNINGITLPANTPNPDSWTTVPYSDTTMGDGTYSVALRAVSGMASRMQVRASGTSSNITRRILVNAEIIDLNPWNNVIFAGTGQTGGVINGNVDIRGSVHILGDDLGPGETAMDLSGVANIGNNYAGKPPELVLPNPPTAVFNGETVESLGAKVRIKNGKLGLSGTAFAGSPDQTGNNVKETLDGVYITDGYGGNKGSENVHSDNGTSNGYDGGNTVSFPSFSDQYTYGGKTYNTYTDYVTTNALQLGASNIEPSTPGGGEPTANFDFSDERNSISWTTTDPNTGAQLVGEGTLTVNGVVYVRGSIDLGAKGTTIRYNGTGTLVALESGSDIKVHGDLLANGTFVKDNTLAFLAEDEVEIGKGGGESQLKVTGFFYGKNKVEADKQAQIAGGLVSNEFEMDQVPSIYQVPSFDPSGHPGLIGRDSIYVLKTTSWQEIQ